MNRIREKLLILVPYRFTYLYFDGTYIDYYTV